MWLAEGKWYFDSEPAYGLLHIIKMPESITFKYFWLIFILRQGKLFLSIQGAYGILWQCCNFYFRYGSFIISVLLLTMKWQHGNIFVGLLIYLKTIIQTIQYTNNDMRHNLGLFFDA